MAIQNQERVLLGDGEVFVKRTSTGNIYAVKAQMTLREALGEIAVIEGKPMIAADGYYRMNQIAALTILTPDSIKVPAQNGEGTITVPNPFPLLDPVSGTQKGVYVKKIVVGYSPTGTLAISSHTMFYNYTTYFLQDLQKKVQYDATAGRLCFKEQLSEDELKKGIFLAIEGEFGIYANTNHKEILKCVSTWLANKNFGERKAQTICERNAMKHHPALAVKIQNLQGAEKNRVGQVTVIGWQHDHSRKEIEDLAYAADAGEEIVINGHRAEKYETTGTVDEEDIVTSAEDLDDVPSEKPSENARHEGGRLF